MSHHYLFHLRSCAASAIGKSSGGTCNASSTEIVDGGTSSADFVFFNGLVFFIGLVSSSASALVFPKIVFFTGSVARIMGFHTHINLCRGLSVGWVGSAARCLLGLSWMLVLLVCVGYLGLSFYSPAILMFPDAICELQQAMFSQEFLGPLQAYIRNNQNPYIAVAARELERRIAVKYPACGDDDGRPAKRACHTINFFYGLNGEKVFCQVHSKKPLVKDIIDAYAKKQQLFAPQLQLVFETSVLDRTQQLDIDSLSEENPQLFMINAVPAIKFIASPKWAGTTMLRSFNVFNSRAGVVVQVGENICPDADTEIAHGSEVALILRGQNMCLKLFEMRHRADLAALKRVLTLDWTTTEDVSLGNGEDGGHTEIILPAHSVLRGHRPRQGEYGMKEYGMVQAFSVDSLYPGATLLFDCSALEIAMDDLNSERSQWSKADIHVEGFTINEALVPEPRPLGRALNIQAQGRPLNVRTKTKLNVLAVQNPHSLMEWAPSSETLISKGCKLFFLKGHKERVQETEFQRGVIVFQEGEEEEEEGESMPFFQDDVMVID